VPGAQLEACYLYEYAREFFERSKLLQGFQKEWSDPAKKQSGKYLQAMLKAWDLLKTRAEMFPPVDFDYFPNVAWQDLPVLSKTAHRGFEIDLREEATTHVTEWVNRTRKSHSDRLHIETLRQCEPANIHSLEAFRDYHEFFHERLGKQDLGNTEYGFFAINWNFKKSQVVGAFAHWLNDQLEARRTLALREAKPKVSRGGFRDKLNWLGALRVKNHFRKKDLVGYDDTNLKVDAPYCHYPDLLDAAKKVEQEIERLFPIQWSEEDYKRRKEESARFFKGHSVVETFELLRGESKGVSSKS
jgi:hypothetical protein